jgi:hypothetical protein
LSTIELDDETCLGAVEIHDVRADRLLTTKAKSIELLFSQAGPQTNLGFGGLFAKPAGTLDACAAAAARPPTRQR